ncbi:MAG: LemA family protein [bacterium]|nr:LemA family protein [bacterium]
MTSTLFWIIIGAGAVVLLWAVATYNRFITLRNRADEAWSDVEVQMQRRYNLIPNLMEAVKGYVKHEATTMERVTAARNAAMHAGTLAEHAQAETMLTGALKTLFAVSEAYPDLKANQNFLELQHELRDAEDKIMAAWRFSNANVRDLNTKLEHFPANIIGALFRFAKKEFFDIDDAIEARVKEVPKVRF